MEIPDHLMIPKLDFMVNAEGGILNLCLAKINEPSLGLLAIRDGTEKQHKKK